MYCKQENQPSESATASIYSCDIHEVAARLKELEQDRRYLEWTPEGTISRLFNGRQARVDFDLPAIANREAYLSLSQLDYLVNLDPGHLGAAYGSALTARHLYLIELYRVKNCQAEALVTEKLRQRAVLAPRNQPRTSQFSVNAAKLGAGLSVATEKTLGQIIALTQQEAHRPQSPGRKIKAYVGLGIFALATLIGVSTRHDQSETSIARATEDHNPLQTVHYYIEALSDPTTLRPAEALLLEAETAPRPEPEPLFSAEPEIGAAFKETAAAEPITVIEAAPSLSSTSTSLPPTEILPATQSPASVPSVAQKQSISADSIPIEELVVVRAAPPLPTTLLLPAETIVKVNADIVRQQLAGNPGSRDVILLPEQQPEKPSVEPEPPTTTARQVVESIAPGYSLTDEQIGWLVAANVSESDWGYVDYIMTKESNWRPWIWNMGGGSAYGLCQRLMSAHPLKDDERYMDDPVAQVLWCHNYAQKRYGSWKKAVEFWQRNHWW